MCGISGEIGFRGARPDRSRVARINAALSSRGPDASGELHRDRVSFAHRRLAIIDLSEAGAQPMSDAALGLDLVFNGCIYNYRDLRRELEALGYAFFSHSDTEIILKAHYAWGEAAPARFHGMFAYALHDQASGAVWLVRDRFGAKPLYYCHDAERLRFASTLPALLAGGSVDSALDSRGLLYFLSFHGAVPGPTTLLRGVAKVPPANILRIDADGAMHTRAYWRLSFARTPDDDARSMDEWVELLAPALRQAVARRMIADRPVGLFLSGGLDSSIIAALQHQVHGPGLRSLAIGFQSIDGVDGNEFQYSDMAATLFATDHRRIVIDSAHVVETLPALFRAMSEPMVSRDGIGFYELSRACAEESLKVVQGGQAADELFAGYGFYQDFAGVADAPAKYQSDVFDFNRAKLETAIDPAWLGEAGASEALVRAEMAALGDADPVDKAIHFHACVKMAEDQLKRVDDTTMAWGVESRLPFIDHELAELSARIPSRHKLAEGGKGVLKSLARRLLPAALVDRPKGYFPVPEIQYPQGRIFEMARAALTAPAARQRGVFREDYLEALFREPQTRRMRSGAAELWYCASLELWLQAHGL